MSLRSPLWTHIGAACAVGLMVRLHYVLSVLDRSAPITGDSETYHLLGRVLARGRGYIRPREFLENGLSVPTAEFPPAYPMVLGALDLVGIDSVTQQRMFGVLIGLVTIVLIGLLGNAIAGRTVGATAAWIAALYPQLVTFDGSLLSEGIFMALVSAALLGVVRAASTTDREQMRWLALTSVATGVAVLTRTEAFLLLCVVFVPAAFFAGERAQWFKRTSIVAAGTITTMTIWTIRNAVALGRFQPFTNNSGTALAGANCDAVYSGTQIGGWRLDCVPAYDSRTTSESEFASEARSTGLDYIGDHLSEVPGVVAVRIARTFGVWDVRTNLFFESLEGRDYDWIWAGWYVWIVLAACAVVAVIMMRAEWKRIWMLLVPFAVVAFMTAITYGNQRFRVAAEPGLVVLAAIGMVRIAGAVSDNFRPDRRSEDRSASP